MQMTHHLHSQHAQRGQAMVEFVVAAMFFLVPLFLAIAAIGKFLDVQHSAEMASRYGAWERTVWYDSTGTGFDSINAPNAKSAANINNEIAARMLSDRSTNTSVIRNDDKTATTFKNGIDPMWKDASGKAYMDTYAQLASTNVSEAPKKDVAGALLKTLGSVGVRGVIGFAPPVPNKTLAVANVKFDKVGAKSEVYKRLWSESPVWAGLQFEATGAILSNTWGANARQGTEGMVRASAPMSGTVGKFLDTAVWGLTPWDPSIPFRVEVGKVAVDELPSDRLK
jgi:hypothetical protein